MNLNTEKSKPLIKYSLILLPALLILIFICIYGNFLLKNISIFANKNKETSTNHKLIYNANQTQFLIQNFSLKNQQDFSFIKMLVIRDQASFKKLPPQTNCGFPSIHKSPEFNIQGSNRRRFARIVKGDEAEPNSFPWMASLKHIRNNIVYEHFCAGSLVYEKYILTAAHCLTDLSKENFVVVLGIYLNKNICILIIFKFLKFL